MTDDPKVRLAQFIDEAKAMLNEKIQTRRKAGLTVDIEWANSEWNLKNVASDRNAGGSALNLYFNGLDIIAVNNRFAVAKTNGSMRGPLLPWLGEFARAVCAYQLCKERKAWKRLKYVLLALRWLDHVLRESPVGGLHELLPHHFSMINSWLDRTDLKEFTKHSYGYDVSQIVDLINKYGLTDQRLSYVNPYANDDSKKEDKTISADVMHILYDCINNPVDDDEQILMELLRLHIATGNRIDETLTSPADDYFKGTNTTLRTLERGDHAKGLNYGIAYFREKSDKGLEIRPLDKQAYDTVKIAVDGLHRLCAPARARAKLLADMPGRFPLPKNADGSEFYSPSEFISRLQIKELFDLSDAASVRNWMESRGGIPSYSIEEARAKGWNGEATGNSRYLHLVADIECACLSDVELVVLRHSDGTPKLWLHELLCVVFQNQLQFGENLLQGTRTLFPERVSQDRVRKELTSGKKTKKNEHTLSLFERRGLTLPNGDPICIRTHQSRHTRTRFLDEAGLSQIQQGHAMGRDPTQNAWYQGGSDINIIQQSNLARLHKTEHSARTAIVKDAVRERLIEGSITDAYHRLRELNVVKAEEFLEEQVGQVLVTRFGACTNEWSGQTCPKHNKCFKRCKSYHVTGVESERIELEKELSIQRVHRAKVKELADEKVYRADTALHNLDNEIAAIEEALARWRRAADRRKELEGKVGILGGIPVHVQVYPDGASHYKEIKRSDGSTKAKGV